MRLTNKSVATIAVGSAVFRDDEGQRTPVVMIELDGQRVYLTLEAARQLYRALPHAIHRAVDLLNEGNHGSDEKGGDTP